MDFIHKFSCSRGHLAGVGSAIISEDKIIIRVNGKYSIKEVGTIENGLGVVLENKEGKKSSCVIGTYLHMNEHLPEQFRNKEYKFRIEGKKLSDNEVAFMYDNAKIITKKK